MSDTLPAAASDVRLADPDQERKVRRAVRVGWPTLRLLSSTWRVRVLGVEPVARLRAANQPVILACWHGQLLPLMWHHRDEGVNALISEHRDGEIVARIAQRLGFVTIRGSTSRGGGRALLAVSRLLKEGHDVAITPDGPRGPALVYAPGALIAAQRSGAPIVPVAMAVSRAWRLRSWDSFAIPKPFARITIAYGEPTWVEATDARGAAAEVARFSALQAAATRRAEQGR